MTMKVSVVIPTYNSQRTIRATIDSVLSQTIAPHEIIVLDDGSTDSTVNILRSYGSQITVQQQENKGVASSRNTLCAAAQGEVVAFLDHDDIWHPTYLEVQRRNVGSHPDLVAFFTGHVNFYGYESYEWPMQEPFVYPLEVMEPATFLVRYCSRTGPFASASFVCVPKRVLSCIGAEPFKIDRVDDSYLFTLLPLLGSVGYAPDPLVAYRFTDDSSSSDRLGMDQLRVEAFRALENKYDRDAPPCLRKLFHDAYASHQRQYSKRLLGVGRRTEARAQLRESRAHSSGLRSTAKSLGLMGLSFMPTGLQPRWPSAHRQDPRDAS